MAGISESVTSAFDTYGAVSAPVTTIAWRIGHIGLTFKCDQLVT